MKRSKQPGTILIVDDDPKLAKLLSNELNDLGLSVETTGSAESAIDMLQSLPVDLVVSDVCLPGTDGLGLLHHVRASRPPVPEFLVMTAYGTIPQAVEALKSGAANFLTKPLNLEHFTLAVQKALEVSRLRRRIQDLNQWTGDYMFHGIVGGSDPMRRLFEQITQVAKSDGPVVILGESGVGKELVAAAIHKESSRRSKRLVPVNCASLPENLLESELFGHVAGAFTGAGKSRNGLFGEADGGTLFLDEIGELPFALQSKLLRVLQDGRIRPVGGDKEKRVNVRVVVATNRDLEEEVKHGRFREDLYYRLEAFTLYVPALRERGDDLDLLASFLLSSCGEKENRPKSGFTAEALERLHAHDFPGNVRELQNAIHRAVVFSAGDWIEAHDLPEKIGAGKDREGSNLGSLLDTFAGNLSMGGSYPSMEEVKTQYARFVLERLDGNKRRAAAILGIGRKTLYEYLKD